MKRKPNLVFDLVNFEVLQEKVGVGKIVELSNEEVNLVAPHIKNHPDTVYAAASGVPPSSYDGYFSCSGELLAIEWVRYETNPQQGEPEINTYRYLLGITEEGKCYGYDVTRPYSDPDTKQVADHWTTFDEVVKKHFPE